MNTWSCYLQNSNTPTCDLMTHFHDFTMIILLFITMMIFFIMFMLTFNALINRFLLQGHMMELIWTIIPILILILIALPSLKILYLIDETHKNCLTMKCMAHQWYWSYEYSDFIEVKFDSFMLLTEQLKINEFRLLDVDNRCILPHSYYIRIITTSADVIHSWTIPSLGVKMDSVPGRLNQTTIFLIRPGLYYGQCSEICGINHSFMPTVIETTDFENFKAWVYTWK